jgi:hypothetical protein
MHSAKPSAGRASRAHADGNRETHLEVLMKKLFPARKAVLKKFAALTTNGSLASAVLLLTSCASQTAHWDAVQMRRHVIDYYNDEIMENLIRAKNGLPFVHVDIVSLSAISTAQIAATVGGGQTLNNSGTNAVTRATGQTVTTAAPTGLTTAVTRALAGAAGLTTTIVNGATRPFTISATPQQSDSLTILGSPAVATRVARCINNYYLCFLNCSDPKCGASVRDTDNPSSLVEGVDYIYDTMKKWRNGRYYYVPTCFKEEYADLYVNIFSTDRPKPQNLQAAPFIVQ